MFSKLRVSWDMKNYFRGSSMEDRFGNTDMMHSFR
jgi:hypothetical protein